MQVLKISGNRITSLSITDSLSTCPQLRHLYLHQNPIDKAPNYQLVVPAILTQLTHLDGKRVDRETIRLVSHSMILEAASALTLISEEMEEERRLEMSIFDAEPEFGEVPDPSPHPFPDTGSELTYGNNMVLAGSASIAIRRRKNRALLEAEEETPLSFLERAAMEPDMRVVPFLVDGGRVDDPEEEGAAIDFQSPTRDSKRPLSAQSPPSYPQQLNSSRPPSGIPNKDPPSQSKRLIRRKSSGFSPPLQVVHVEDAFVVRPPAVHSAPQQFVSQEYSMSSDSDDDAVVPAGSSKLSGTGGVRRARSSRSGNGGVGQRMGIDLEHSLLAIADWARSMGDSDDSDCSQRSPVSRRATVLSRETILSMVRLSFSM